MSSSSATTTKVLSQQEILHKKFLELIKGTRLCDKGILVVNIIYDSCLPKYVKTWPKRCMLYDIKKPDNFLSKLQDRMKDTTTSYDIVEATDNKILIKDEQDFYGAMIQQALYSPKCLVMEIQLSRITEEEEDDNSILSVDDDII